MTDGPCSRAVLDLPRPQIATALVRADFDLRPFTDRSNLRGAWQVLNTLVPLALLWGLAVWALSHGSWLLIPLMALQVLFLARSFSLMHDCGHDTLFRHRTANRWVGFLLGVVAGIPQLPWAQGHAFHHRHNGDWEKYQGPSALVSTEAFDRQTPAQQRRYRGLRHPLMLLPGGFFYLVLKPRLALLLGVKDLVPELIQALQHTPQADLFALVASHRSRHWHSPREGRDLLLNNIAVLAAWWAMTSLLGAGAFWTIYAPVMACAAAIVICIFFVQHNFPHSYAHRTEGWNGMTGVLEGTSNLELPALLNWFSADIGCHAIHHLCAAIPNYRLRACEQRNAALLTGVTRLSLRDIPGCFGYILWDPQAGRLTTIDSHRAGLESHSHAEA
ncbi:fatty acid desaturase [Cyanobium sp. FGCU-52]|nr:fatty acid desaturase [Cyanobium sp. FGCU52]